MKPKTTIILAGLLLAFIVYALFISGIFDGSKPEKEPATQEQAIFEPAPGMWVKLTVEGKGGTFVFEKDGDDWRILQPVRAKAEKWRVDDIADPLKDLKGRPVEGGDAEPSGLATPRWTLTAVDDKNVTHKLLVGNPRPLEKDQTYVRPAGSDKTFLAKVDFAYKLDKTLGDFRDDTVLELDKDKIARLAVSGKTSFELVKRDEKWRVVKPVAALADEEKVKDLLGKFTSLSASEFVSDAPADLRPYGLDQPRLIVRIEMAPEEPKTPTTAKAETQPTTQPTTKPKVGKKHGLAIGKQIGDKLYAKLLDEPCVFKIDNSLVKDLQPKVVELRDKKVMRLAADEVVAVQLALPGGAASLAKADGQWQMAAPHKGPADEQAVKDLLDDVAGLKAEDFKDEVTAPEVYGLDKPAATLTFRLEGKDETTALLIGSKKSKSGEMTFVRSKAGTAVAVVKTADAKKLLADPAAYWQRRLLKLPSEAKIAKVELRRTDATFILARDPNDDWSLSSPLAGKADKDQVNKVIDHLDDLKADKIVALGKDVPEKYAKSKSIMQVIFTTETPSPGAATQPASKPAAVPAASTPATSKPAATKPAPKPIVATHKITVAKIGSNSFSWVDGGEILAVGQFAAGLYDDLAGRLRDKKIWSVEPDDVTGVKLHAVADSLDLKKDGDAWQYTPDKYVKIDAQKVADFLKDVKDVNAKTFVTHKPPADASKFGLDKPWLRLQLTDKKGATSMLVVSHTGATKTEDRYATASTVQGVFILEADMIGKLGKKLKDFKK